MRNSRGFTLIEFSVVLFVLGLLLWLVAPRLASVVGPDRNSVFREISSGSEAAFDLALFEKREVRLVLDPSAGTFLFRQAEGAPVHRTSRGLGDTLAITGVRVEGEDRPPDIVTEIRYLPGGKVASCRIFFRDSGTEGDPTEWTLRINPYDGSVDVLEGKVLDDA